MNIPEAKFEFHHRTPVQTRFNDVDMFGHLNNSVYMQFADLAKMHYFRQFMGGEFDPRRLGVVVANINCDFYAPAYIDDRLEVLTAVVSIANSSLVMEQRIIDERSQVKCICRSVMVGFNVATAQAEPISNQWRRDLSAYEGRELSK